MKTTAKRRYLITVYYSDWIEAESKDEALDAMHERIHDLKRHEWEINCEDEEGEELPDENIAVGSRYCDQGCGYKLPEEYADDETTCGACMDELQGESEGWPS